MAGNFLLITKQALAQHGKVATYKRISASVYNIETGINTNTTSSFSITMYKKHIKATQYNYPNLIGKDIAMFYIASDSLSFLPAIKDEIVFDSVSYIVDSYVEHAAQGQVVLFKIIAVRG